MKTVAVIIVTVCATLLTTSISLGAQVSGWMLILLAWAAVISFACWMSAWRLADRWQRRAWEALGQARRGIDLAKAWSDRSDQWREKAEGR